MKKVVEVIYNIYPLVFGIISFLFFLFFSIDYTIMGFQDVLNSIITFSSIIIGFYTAMYGVLISLNNTDIFKKFLNNKIDGTLKKQLYESLIISFLILIVSIALQVLMNYQGVITELTFFSWSFLLGYFLSTSFRAISLLLRIMFNHNEKTRESTKDNISEKTREEIKEKLRK